MSSPSNIVNCFLGVDPGSTNTGVAVVDKAGKLVHTEHFSPTLVGFSESVQRISALVLPHTSPVLTIERYVAYEGKHNAASEQILMLIGALVYEFERRGETVFQVRAIDWKTQLCKVLFKTQGFKNPSSTFDKKYSLAAATALSSQTLKTDHEADAVCLAYIGKMRM